jgi:hypothetical protein
MIALLVLPAMALADWSENFDSYAAGSQIVGQGGWEEWAAGSGGFVSNAQAKSTPNSLEIAAGSDVVHQYSGYTTGKWFYKTWHFIPSDMSGVTYFIMLNTYAYPSGPYFWSVQMGFDSSDGLIKADCGSSNQVANVRYLTGQWAEIRVYVDFDEDWCQVYYNGQLLDDPLLADHPTLGGGYTWTAGVFGADVGALNIGACDLFANGATPAYFDDMSLAPATIWADVKVNGSDTPGDITVGQKAKISCAFVAGDQLGNNGDVWIVLDTPLAGQLTWLSYDGVGGVGGTGWHTGYLNELVSGAIGNYFEIPLDWTMGNALKGNYKAFLAADGIANGRPDLQSVLIMDVVPFKVVQQ